MRITSNRITIVLNKIFKSEQKVVQKIEQSAGIRPVAELTEAAQQAVATMPYYMVQRGKKPIWIDKTPTVK